jgi:hypothetical protein
VLLLQEAPVEKETIYFLKLRLKREKACLKKLIRIFLLWVIRQRENWRNMFALSFLSRYSLSFLSRYSMVISPFRRLRRPQKARTYVVQCCSLTRQPAAPVSGFSASQPVATR